MKFLLLTALLFSTQVIAWSVTPMSQDIKPGQRTFQIKIINKEGVAPVALRLKVMSRDINEFGGDKLTNTNDLLVFPKRMMVPAGKQLIARISVRKPNSSNHEKAYRLIVDQIPVKNTTDKNGIQVLTRYLTSVYLNPKQPKKVDFKIDSASIKASNIEIMATNNGNYHKVLLLSSINIGGTDIQTKIDPKNVLPGKSLKILLPVEHQKFKSGDILSFQNTCMICPKDESYQIPLN